MPENLYPPHTARTARRRRSLAPKTDAAFAELSERVFAEGALPAKTKELIAIAVAHVTQCPYCIRSHTRRALRRGATAEEIMESIWIAAEMRAGAAVAHAAIAIDAMESEVLPRNGNTATNAVQGAAPELRPRT
jgi:AhpD family alkylhydroperoxidase